MGIAVSQSLGETSEQQGQPSCAGCPERSVASHQVLSKPVGPVALQIPGQLGMAEREVQAPSSGQSLWRTWHPNPHPHPPTKLACPLPAQLSLFQIAPHPSCGIPQPVSFTYCLRIFSNLHLRLEEVNSL